MSVLPDDRVPVSLSFHGAVGTVTGSTFLLRRGGREILVDFGMYQGERRWRERNWQPMPFAASDVDGSRHRMPAPLYRPSDVEAAIKLLTPIDYGATQQIVDDITVTFSRAGHILGAASALLDLGGETVLFSGDLGRADRVHPPAAAAHDVTARAVRDTIGAADQS